MTTRVGHDLLGGAEAPEALAARAHRYLWAIADSDASARCASASRVALDAAMAGTPRREAALDLLAADALITAALLEVARHRPAALLEQAVALRRVAQGTR